MQLDLSSREIDLLQRALTDHLEEQRRLLARTDAPEAQHDFALDVGELEGLLQKLQTAAATGTAQPTA